MAEKKENFRARVKKRLRRFLTRETLTLRGELVITRAGMVNITQGDFEQLALKPDFQKLKKELHGAKLTVQYGVCDVTVRLFAYHVKAADGVFDRLQDIFSHIASQVYDDEEAELSLRLDVLGDCESVRGRRKVRFLNKREQVAYRLTEDESAEDTALTKLKRKILEE